LSGSPLRWLGKRLPAADRYGPLGNERLTAAVGLVLLVLSMVELGTVVFGLHQLLAPHVFVGLVLIPPVLLKLASTGWRFARYYTGSEPYVKRGAPQIGMRLLAPLLVVATVVLFASGVAMGILHGHSLLVARRLHGPASVLWMILLGVHVLAYIRRALTSSKHDLERASQPPVQGARTRLYVLAASIVAGVVVGAATLPVQHHWLHLRHDHERRDATARFGVAEPGRGAAALAVRATWVALSSPPRIVQTNEPVRVRSPLPGALLIADRGNDRLLLVDSHHRVLWHFPTARDLASGVHLYFDDDSFVEPGGRAIVSNEEEAHTIVSVNIRTHQRIHLYGTPGVRGSGPNQLNTPDDAYVLAGGTLTVADAYNCRILFIRAHRIVRQFGTTGVCRHDPPRSFGAVNGDTPLGDGGVLVSEIQGSWIDDISRQGSLRWAVQAPVSYPSDPQLLGPTRILLADYANPGAAVIINRKGRVLWRYGPASGWGALDHPSLAFRLPNGDIAINDDYKDRVVIVDPHTNRIVWQYGHASLPGRGPNQLNTPDGMDFVPLGSHEIPLWQLVHHP
jgi:hypothetical protein